MKRVISGVFSAMFLLGALTVQAQKEKTKEKYEFVKEKTIAKTYTASGNKLSIDNSFGQVKFITWTKNEIKVDIHIEAGSNQESLAQKILDAISVSDKHQGNEIEFKTKIDNKNDNCKGCKSSMQIDYEVHLPVSVPLNVTNSFCDIELHDYTGAFSFTRKFGSLNSGSLSNLKSIGLEFGSATLKNISNVDATFKFSKIDIASLGGKNTIKLEFCDATKIGLANNLTSLNLHESYSTVNIKPGNVSASYTI